MSAAKQENTAPPRRFKIWCAGFRAKAMRNGIAARLYDDIFHDLRSNTEVLTHDQAQPEATQTIWDYLDRAVSERRIADGQTALREHARLLQRIERRFDVDPTILTAIWGLETAYGVHRGKFAVIEALATLAHDGRRGLFFERQLLAALKIVQAGDIPATRMTGSWAGAMGHTQFMPTSFLACAVDFDCDGARDIWGADPCDALASTAAYLLESGWQKGAPLLHSVALTKGFDFKLCQPDTQRSVQEWQILCVDVGLDLDTVPGQTASVLVPAGATGPAFMVFDNFSAVLRYNRSLPYALAVALLAKAINGDAPLTGTWPRDDRVLSRAEKQEFQHRLNLAGHDAKAEDGIFGRDTFAALRRYQLAESLVADGYPTHDLLLRLRR